MKRVMMILGATAIVLFALNAHGLFAEDSNEGSEKGSSGSLDYPIDLQPEPPSGTTGEDPGGTAITTGGGTTTTPPDKGASESDPLSSGGEDQGQPEETTEEEEELAEEIEFFETPIEADEVIFCVDRTGSMAYPFSRTVVDLEGNIVPNATKMQAVVFEMKKTITAFSDNIKFDVVFWAHRYGREYGSPHYGYPPSPQPANHTCPPDGDPDTMTWKPGGAVEATSANKTSAFQWIDVNAVPNGCTPISDGCKAAINIPNAKTILLLSDGFPQTFQKTIYFADQDPSLWDYCMGRTRQEIKQGNAAKLCTIHTFFILYGRPDFDPVCRKLMQDIAADNGGQYTEIGQ